MPDNFIFYIVFLSQITLLSIYFPRKICQRFNTVITRYPASEYPKLYIKPFEYYKLALTIYKVINRVILLIGLLLIVGIGYWDHSSNEEIEGVFSLFYFMLQMFPFMLMELSEFSNFKKMRQADIRTIRSAPSRPRHLFDFISAKLVGLAVFTNISCVVYVFYLDNFEFSLVGDTAIILIALAASNLLYAIIIRFNINGKKMDPYQDASDRFRQTQNVVKSLVTISIVASLFILLQQAMNMYDLDNLQAIFISLYLQVIAWLSLGQTLNALKLEKINFDVYKKDMTVN